MSREYSETDANLNEQSEMMPWGTIEAKDIQAQMGWLDAFLQLAWGQQGQVQML